MERLMLDNLLGLAGVRVHFRCRAALLGTRRPSQANSSSGAIVSRLCQCVQHHIRARVCCRHECIHGGRRQQDVR